ncbi:hypothetical protein [Streptomyces hygroscopicus]|uniref:hypothetical protein n=1 Tax=Streptomyces hygroscopicus TaxID=1912 RepID=UPI0006901850|nr:hypothetical protein [Streptomyces hygroscopicus]
MGVGIEVLIVDWPRVEATKPSAREELLIDAAFGEVHSDDLFEHGWSWPTRPDEDWYARYAFRDTIGSYKPHFWAGHRWEHLRDVVEPQAREADSPCRAWMNSEGVRSPVRGVTRGRCAGRGRRTPGPHPTPAGVPQ